MHGIPVIGLYTPQQTEALQAATGMLVMIGRNGARLVQATDFKGLLDAYEQVDLESVHSSYENMKGECA